MNNSANAMASAPHGPSYRLRQVEQSAAALSTQPKPDSEC